MTSLPTVISEQVDCWNKIGVRGDHSCPELLKVVHCQNCPIFAQAGQQFLNAPSPPGYLEEWSQRLADPIEEEATDLQSVLIFRLGNEWLALPIGVLVEVTAPLPVHRIPHRGGLLAGLVNIRGELYLCVRLAAMLGIMTSSDANSVQPSRPRLLVVRRDTDRWVFPVDEVDQAQRFPTRDLKPVPATVARSAMHLTRGVFHFQGRSIGYFDDARLFQALRTRVLR